MDGQDRVTMQKDLCVEQIAPHTQKHLRCQNQSDNQIKIKK